MLWPVNVWWSDQSAMDASFSPRRSGFILMSSSSISPCRGLTASKRRANSCASQRPARLVFLTVHEDADYARAALDAGGLGYVVKTRLASDLLPGHPGRACGSILYLALVRLEEANRLLPIPQRNELQHTDNNETNSHFIQNPQCLSRC